MAAVEIRSGYVAVKEAGRQEGREEGRQEGLLTGARQTKVDMLCDGLLPAVGRPFVEQLRVWLEDDELLALLDVNRIFELRLRHGADPEGLRQAVRDLLGKA